MAATTVGAVLIFAAIAALFWAIKTKPELREPSLTPLQDAYAPPDDEEDAAEAASLQEPEQDR